MRTKTYIFSFTHAELFAVSLRLGPMVDYENFPMKNESMSVLKKTQYRTPLLYVLMILLGIWSGFTEIVFFKSLGLFISNIFIRIFKCVSLPIIALSIIVTLSHYKSDGLMRRVWQRTLFYTLTTTLIAASMSFILYQVIAPESVTQWEESAPAMHHTMTYWEHVAGLIPQNFLTPFLENQVLSVLFLGIVIGIAVRFIPDREARQTITHFFRGLHSLLMVMTRWVITVIPIGLYGFITTTVVELRGGGDLKGIGQYLLVIVLANLIQGLVILPLWLRINHISPFKMMRGMLPALSLAFFSKSSAGTLPVTMDVIEKKLKVRPEISRFVLPLCTSINMNGCAAFIFTTVIYLMQNHGVPITLGTLLIWIVVSTVAAIGNAGVPMGCFFLSVSLLASMNIPIALMGLILPFYSLIDMLETALNVWSDSCVTKIIDKRVIENE
jgi:Na+/H+-dicarboxylate symporter